MEKITFSFAALGAIIALTIPQACVGTASTQCAKPTLIPSDATRATTSVTVKIATSTAGAYLRYTLDGSTPSGGSSGNGTQIAAARGKVSFTVGPREKTLKAIAYKPGLADSSIAEATYVYESPYGDQSKAVAVIRVYDDAGNVIETHEHADDFKEW
jgi:hypothetical protein